MKEYIPVLMVWLIIGFTFFMTTKVFSQASQQGNMDTTGSAKTSQDKTSPYVKGITTGRGKALVGVVSGLTSLIIGVMARRRSAKQAGPGKGRNGAIVALMLGLTGIIVSIVHLSTSAGAVFGSGSGKAGAIFALLLSVAGITLGWFTLRSRKTA